MKRVLKLVLIGIMVIFPSVVHAETIDVNAKEVKTLVSKYNIGDMNFYEFKDYNIDTMKDAQFAAFTSYLNYQLFDKNKTERIGSFNEHNVTFSVITKEIYNQGFKNVFGPDISVKSSQLNTSEFCGTYEYNTTSDDYQAYEACGFTAPFDFYVDSATKTNQSIIINLKGTSRDNNYIYLGSNEKKVDLENLGVKNSDLVLKEDFLKKYKSYLNTYKYTFKKASDGEYYFYSVENLKDAKEYKSSTTTVKKTSTKETNPKTSDANLLLLIGVGISMIFIIVFSSKKVLKK